MNVNGCDKQITIHWEGLLSQKILLYIDGEVACCFDTQQTGKPLDTAYGQFILEGNLLEFDRTCQDWRSLKHSTIVLRTNGIVVPETLCVDLDEYDRIDKAKRLSKLIHA